ncbi:MAG: hypothetical protein DA407_10895 [Bacteroidetes bacterium]|nr:MAG: hypothetical protein DA407_10895 [Bacteroidota bacterium]
MNIPDEHVILKDSLHTINVTISTYGFNFLKYYFVNPKLQVDFNKLKKNSVEYLWIKNDEFQNVVNQISASTEVKSINPDTIKFNYDTYFVKSVPIVLKHDVKYAPGFDIDDKFNLKPDSVKIIGAKATIDTIAKIETEMFSINDVNANISASISLKLPISSPDIKFSENQVLVSGTVEKFTEGSFFVPIIVTNIPENVSIKYFPKEIEVLFYSSLDYYKTITVNNFRVECDYNNLDQNNNKLVPIIVKQPEKVKNVRLGMKSIEFIIL